MTTQRSKDEPESAAALKLGWQRVLLVCRQCQKRGSGPSRLKTKEVAAALKAATKRSPVRTRIALTGCLGPCPKKAITVALPATAGRRAEGWAVADAAEARALGRALARDVAGVEAAADATDTDGLRPSPAASTSER